MRFGPLEIRWHQGLTFAESGHLTVNGHSYVRDWAVGPFLKQYDEPCENCGSPCYAHQINVLDLPACDLFRGTA